MRMTEDKFFILSVGNLANIEAACFFSDFGVEENVEQHIAEFFLDFGCVVRSEERRVAEPE